MQSAEKFMFEVSFDNDPEVPSEQVVDTELPIEEEVVEEVIVPTFSEEELDIARQQGFEAGKQEGLAATTETLTKQMNETLTLIDQKLQAAFQNQDIVNEMMANSALSVAKGICSKMLPALAQKHSFDEVDRVITAVFAKLVEQPRATINVHSSLVEMIEQRVTELSIGKGYEGKINMLADETMEPGDCKVEWANGGCERDSQAIWDEITTIVERNLSGTPTLWDEPEEKTGNIAITEDIQPETAIETDPTEAQADPEEEISNELQQPNIDD